MIHHKDTNKLICKMHGDIMESAKIKPFVEINILDIATLSDEYGPQGFTYGDIAWMIHNMGMLHDLDYCQEYKKRKREGGE